MSSKKINTSPINIKQILSKLINFLLEYFVFLVVFVIFLFFYRFTHKVYPNDYILDTMLNSDIYYRQCLYLDKKDPDLIKKLGSFYENMQIKYLVPMIFFKKMPSTLIEEPDFKLRKYVYINILLPILLKVQKETLKERSRLVEISSRMSNEPLLEQDFIFLENLAEKYDFFLEGDNFWNYVEAVDDLLLKVDIIPNSLAIAISAKETEWGASHFLKEGNSLFSQSYLLYGSRIFSLIRSKEQKHIVRKFNNLEEAVRTFYLDININNNYRDFRETRRNMRLTEGHLRVKRLTAKINNYSTENNYLESLNKIISENSLEKFDNSNDFSTKYKKTCLTFM